jgi:hypothetical protein
MSRIGLPARTVRCDRWSERGSSRGNGEPASGSRAAARTVAGHAQWDPGAFATIAKSAGASRLSRDGTATGGP